MGFETRPVTGDDLELVRPFLSRRGFGESLIDWKYGRRALSSSEEVGYALLRDGEIDSFVGLIPFELKIDGQDVRCAWTCDWHSGDGGFGGLKVLRKAIADHDFLLHIGGNEVTQQIFQRIAAVTVDDGARIYRASLRVGDYLRRAERRFGLDGLGIGALGGFSLPGRVGAREDTGQSDEGVADSISSALVTSSEDTCRPLYDRAYVDWQIGRCPEVESFTWTDDSSTGAAAVVWRTGEEAGFWRMAVLPGSADRDGIERVVRGAVSEADRRGALAVSVLASRFDTRMCEQLEACGLVHQRSLPVHVLTAGDRGDALRELTGLSFLDDDLASTFH